MCGNVDRFEPQCVSCWIVVCWSFLLRLFCVGTIREGKESFFKTLLMNFWKFPSYCKIFLIYFFVSGDIGGNMGLFLGCSLLTLFEFVHLLWNFLTFRANRVKHVKGKPKCNSDSGEVWDINSDQVKIVRCTFIQT